MAVPEAPMNEDGPPSLLVGKIRVPCEALHMLAKAHPERMNGGSCHYFRTRVSRSDAGHDLRPREGITLSPRSNPCNTSRHLSPIIALKHYAGRRRASKTEMKLRCSTLNPFPCSASRRA